MSCYTEGRADPDTGRAKLYAFFLGDRENPTATLAIRCSAVGTGLFLFLDALVQMMNIARGRTATLGPPGDAFHRDGGSVANLLKIRNFS